VRSRHFVLPVALLSVGAALLGSQPATAPSLVILNARIVTGAPTAPLAEAVTIATQGERRTPRRDLGQTKWVLDGTPIERLMFLREPYSDRRETPGRLNFPAEDVTGFLRRAFAVREQPMFHAVGDAAIDTVLNGLERTGGDSWQPLRPRIEHGDMLEPSHFDRAKRLGVVVVQNPSHFMLPAFMRKRLGDRVGRVTMMKSMIGGDVTVALGSDGPLNPYLNLMFATINANHPVEAMTREQAVTAYTLGSARGSSRRARRARFPQACSRIL
jgi:predicted amidohydrolase YtcJ